MAAKLLTERLGISTVDRRQRSEVGSQRSEIRGQKSEIRSRRSEVKNKAKTEFDIKIKDTFDLIEKIKNNELPDKIMINVHPQRWNDEFVPWARELVWQNVKNVVKRQIIKFRD